MEEHFQGFLIFNSVIFVLTHADLIRVGNLSVGHWCDLEQNRIFLRKDVDILPSSSWNWSDTQCLRSQFHAGGICA